MEILKKKKKMKTKQCPIVCSLDFATMLAQSCEKHHFGFQEDNTTILGRRNTFASDVLQLNLSQFAAEDEGRTEDPTEKRIKEAREKGQVAKTQELAQALTLLVGFFTFYLLSLWFLYEIMMLTKRFFGEFWQYTFGDGQMKVGFFFVMWLMMKLLLPIFAVTFISALLANLMQVGFMFTLKPLAMDFSKIKLDPASMMKKVFFSRQVGMNLLKTLFKVIVVGYLSYIIIAGDFELLMKTSQLSPMQALFTISFSVFKVVIWISLLLLVLSIPDYFFQKSELKEQLKMTKRDVKQEYKEQEGDPYMRSRLRARREEMLRNRMISEVPQADVIITNPTHYAVALRMNSATRTPEVIAKGEGYLARKIKEIGREHSIEIIENKPLAQALYHRVKTGQEIPSDLYRIVVDIYTLLIQKHPSKYNHLRNAG